MVHGHMLSGIIGLNGCRRNMRICFADVEGVAAAHLAVRWQSFCWLSGSMLFIFIHAICLLLGGKASRCGLSVGLINHDFEQYGRLAWHAFVAGLL